AYPAYRMSFQARIEKRSFIVSNFKLNIPIIFPWLILSFAYDLLALSPWSGPDSFLGRPEGQMTFFAVFLVVLMIYMPQLIQYWWGCKPVKSSEKVDGIKVFLEKMKFRYRNILTWPIFEGRMMTAGIMGIVARYRYLLVTDSLMEVLSPEELKAVMAHEVGHARYRHLLFYVLFFLGYMILSFGLFDLFFYVLASQPYFMELLGEGESSSANLFYLALSIPILISMFVYFRFAMGYFMRNFERQADLYSAKIMGSPMHVISALEKIAMMSGKSRNIPSWHHFSIKERVDCLWRTIKEPELNKKHTRFIAKSLAVYLIVMISLIYTLNSDGVKKNLGFRLLDNSFSQQLIKEPDNIMVLQNLAMAYHDMERYEDAMKLYEKILSIDNQQAAALNNLAWLLVTAPDKEILDSERALVLAKRAVALERSSTFLDTLAEAYFMNGSPEKAIETINEVIELETGDDSYFRKQLEKFRGAF
ncbi:M48 family metalloprotease, partial [Thermodesulfobacteriota bacterium]